VWEYGTSDFKASMWQREGGYWEPITKYQNCYHMWCSANMVYKPFDNISFAEIAGIRYMI
jgi:hypothetical protein